MSEQPETSVPALFEDRGQLLTASSDAAAVARATQEIQAALVIAQRFPRDEIKARQRVLQACTRKGLAEVAEYEYSRGGTRITGPTIDLLRAIASRWGHLRWGWSEVERREGASMVRCWAWDLQSGSQAERTFSVRHWRDTAGGGYALEDDRDIYELLANQAARRVRACMEEVIDSDIVSDAVDACRKTLKEGEKTPLKDRLVKLLLAFEPMGVTREKIEALLGNNLDSVSENQLAKLRRIYKSIQDGVGEAKDFFKPVAAKPEFPGGDGKAQAPAAKPQPSQEEKEEAAAGLAPVPKPAAKPEPKPEPQAAPVEPAEESPAFNPLKAVRNLAKLGKVKEGVLVGYLAEIGATDGSPATLEEVQLQYPAVLKHVAEHWENHLKKLKAGAAE